MTTLVIAGDKEVWEDREKDEWKMRELLLMMKSWDY